jgi:uncharacterized protein (DUF2236 family)
MASSGATGSEWIAFQTIHPSATIGIFSPTISHTNAHVTVARMLPGNTVPEQVLYDPGREMSDTGLFGPDSVTWRVNREGALLLGGGRALLLQVAHPLVAAGVSQHSNYREDPFGRLFRTLDTVTTIVFGSTPEAKAAAARLHRVHTRVKGDAEDGTPYVATDPALIMWVHATLVDTSLLVYENYVGRLTAAERDRYYDEQKLLGEQYGVPVDQQPASYGDFRAYFDETVHGGTLQVTDSLRDVAAATLKPQLPVPFVGRPVVEYFNLVTTALMPVWIREELGLAWGPRRARLHAAQRNLIRRLIPVLPSLLRELPPARSAERRVRAAA